MTRITAPGGGAVYSCLTFNGLEGLKMNTAQTILAQLGGNKFVAMTGAKNLIDCGKALRFQLPARFAREGINLVSVKLNDSDTYTVTFSKYRGLKVREIASHSLVYADQLRSVFTAETGLAVSL